MGERRTSRRRVARIVGPLLAVVCLFGVLAASAGATVGYQDQASFAVEALNEPTDAAFDPTSGDLLVTDHLNSNGRVTVFGDPSGSATAIAEFAPNVGELPTSIAVDPLSGDVYVSGPAGIVRFVSDGQTPPTYTVDAGYTAPTGGSGPGQVGNFAAALAVDPGNGDLLVADKGNQRISRYSSSGAFIESFDGSSGGGGATLTNPIDLAVEPGGGIDVLNLEGSINSFGEVEGTSQIRRFTSTGTLIEAVDPTLTEKAAALAFDPATEDLLFARQIGWFQNGPTMLVVLHDGVVIQEAPYSRLTTEHSFVPGIAVAAQSHVYAVTGRSFNFSFGENSVQLFERVTFPEVSLSPPTGVTARDVHVSGTVDPDGVEATFRFEYSPDGGANWLLGLEGSAGEGHGAVPVEGDIQGLLPNLEYLVRLRALNSEAERTSPPRSFRTVGAPPTVVTGGVSEPGAAEPELLGAVDPQGSQTQYFFEYGTTGAYGMQAPAQGVLVAGTGRTDLNVSVAVGGLVPGTLYHYRIVGSNPAGKSFGEDRTFVAGGPGEARAYEMVSPVEKGNVGAATYNETAFARADGNSMLFGSDKASYPGAQAANYIPRNLAARTPSGWVTRSLDPPSFSEKAGGDFFGVLAISEDQSRALVVSRYALTPDASGGDAYLYILDIASGSYTLVSPIEKDWASFQSKEWLFGTSPDLGTIAFATGLPLVSDAAPVRNEYVWRQGSGLSLLSRDSEGNPFSDPTAIFSEFVHEPDPVSRDGSRIYFMLQGGPVYLRENGVTRAISVSHIPGAPKTPVPARFVKASPDGRYAIISEGAVNSTETVPPLTPDAPVGVPNRAYLYDAVTGELHYLSGTVDPSLVIGFPALDKMFYAAVGGTGELLYGHDGITSPITGPSPGFTGGFQASDSGRFLVFEARGNVTGYDSGGNAEVYRFDSLTEQLICVSCRSDGGRSLGGAAIGQREMGGQSSLNHHFPRSVLDDGTVFFDTPDPLVGRDVNGVRDVYEYRDGQTHLVSPGDSNAPAEYIEATADGRNVFFTTAQPLVPQDKDVLSDVYDARVGGGFGPPAEAQACSGNCRVATASPPTSAAPASELVPGQQRPAKHRKKRKVEPCRKAAKGKKKKGRSHCHAPKNPKAKKHHRGGVR